MIKPLTCLLVCTLGGLIFSAPIAFFASYHSAVVWVCITGLGVSMSAVVPTSITWASGIVKINGVIMGMVVAAACGDEAVGPMLMASLLTRYGMVSYSYVLLGLACLGIVTYVILVCGTNLAHALSQN